MYNPVGKTIVSQNNISPEYMLSQRLKVDKLTNEQAEFLPRVTHWSDIVWLIWALLCPTAEEASALKYIFRENIVTSNTRYIMEQCFVGVERDALDIEWPGWVFYPTDEPFYALLATPHGMLPSFFFSFFLFFFFSLSFRCCVVVAVVVVVVVGFQGREAGRESGPETAVSPCTGKALPFQVTLS